MIAEDDKHLRGVNLLLVYRYVTEFTVHWQHKFAKLHHLHIK